MNHPSSDHRPVAPTVIAVVGCDGSGKSTLSRWLVEELGKSHATRFLYFGTGDGPGSRLRRTLNWLKKKSRYGKPPVQIPAPVANTGITDNTGAEGQLAAVRPASLSSADKAPTVLRLVWAGAVLFERMGKLRDMTRAAEAGTIIVTDRYPQAEFWGIHDGPRLGYLLETRSNGLLHRIAGWEQTAYLKMTQRKPDLVLLLDVPVKLARERRAEEPFEELRKRIHVARSLTFQGADRLVLDSSEPLNVVQKKALQAVLEKVSGHPAQNVDPEHRSHITEKTIEI